MAKFKLTSEQKLELNNAELQLDKAQLIKRITAIKLRDKGLNNIEIGDILMKSDQTISNWVQIYLKEGLNSLLQWNYKGRPSILSIEMQEKLKERNARKAFDKASEVQAYIKEEFNIEYHLHWVQKLLKKNFNLHIKKHS